MLTDVVIPLLHRYELSFLEADLNLRTISPTKTHPVGAMDEISIEYQDSDTTVSLSSDHPAWSQNQHYYDIVDGIPSDIEDVALHE